MWNHQSPLPELKHSKYSQCITYLAQILEQNWRETAWIYISFFCGKPPDSYKWHDSMIPKFFKFDGLFHWNNQKFIHWQSQKKNGKTVAIDIVSGINLISDHLLLQFILIHFILFFICNSAAVFSVIITSKYYIWYNRNAHKSW